MCTHRLFTVHSIQLTKNLYLKSVRFWVDESEPRRDEKNCAELANVVTGLLAPVYVVSLYVASTVVTR